MYCPFIDSYHFLSQQGLTDLPEDELEATVKSITLIEDFTAFDAQLPPLRYSCQFAVSEAQSGVFTN